MNVKFDKGLRQSESLLFAKAPSEIRRMVFLELFGNRQIHITLNQSKLNHIKYTREGRPLSRRKWVHCVCRRHPDSEVHSHNEIDHKWVFISAGIIFTCKRAFEQGIRILYATNTLIFDLDLTLDDFNSGGWHRYNSINLNLDFSVGIDFKKLGLTNMYGEGGDHFTALCDILSTMKQKLSVRIAVSRDLHHSPQSETDKIAGLKGMVFAFERLCRKDNVTGKLSLPSRWVDDFREVLMLTPNPSQKFEVIERENEWQWPGDFGEYSDDEDEEDTYWRNHDSDESDSEVTELGNEY
ncbi:hypothetical protein NW762_001379 [Fusarium torreyae]|uniref:DUF7730 domain-containing protein n=1 Tax=Fusarium torreyae TaxID=1237075 RepID=A0A9W8SDY6_9HYPO|nr:hypothetical protein NW762_001379 [Fusarium torreyae]